MPSRYLYLMTPPAQGAYNLSSTCYCSICLQYLILFLNGGCQIPIVKRQLKPVMIATRHTNTAAVL